MALKVRFKFELYADDMVQLQDVLKSCISKSLREEQECRDPGLARFYAARRDAITRVSTAIMAGATPQAELEPA